MIKAKANLVKKEAEHTDVKGAIFLLKNRYPTEFRDTIVQELTGTEGVPL